MHDFNVRHVVALAFTAAFACTAHAQTAQEADRTPVQLDSAAEAAQQHSDAATPAATPPAGPQFGQHVSSMAPEHPREHGEMFGDCVSEMAVTGECSHH